MKKFLILLLLLFPALLMAQSADHFYNTAHELGEKGEYAAAVKEYTKAINMEQDFLEAYYNRGWCLYRLGRYEECIQDFSFIITKDPSDAGAYISRGLARTNLGYYNQALADYSKAAQLDPQDKVIYNNIGVVKEHQGEFQEALANYSKAISLDPAFATAIENKKRLEGIMKVPGKVHTSDKMTAKDLYKLGAQSGEEGDYESALSYYDKAIAMDSNYKLAYDSRGWTKYMLGRYAEAIADFDKSLSLADNKWAFNQRGMAKLKLNRYEQALADFDRALVLDSEYSAAKENKKWVLQKINEIKTVDTKSPVISITSPTPSRGFDVVRLDEAVTIIGKATDESGVEKVIINGITARLNASGDFDAEVKLATGKNNITIVAFDFKGNKAEQVFVIERKPQVTTTRTQESVVASGKNYALLIATDTYNEWDNLNNPVKDANAIAAELKGIYGFETEILLNASRDQILLKLRQYAQKTYEPNDQLFIFFAGHGHFDDVFNEGYVVTKESRKNDQGFSSYLSHSTLRTYLNNIKSKHIFLVMDVCFGGTIDPVVASRGENKDYENVSKIEFINRKLRYKTRRYLTSGGKEYVSDGKAGMHSPFARKLLEALRSYGGEDGILTINEILLQVESLQPEPRYGEFGDNEPGSDFIFISK